MKLSSKVGLVSSSLILAYMTAIGVNASQLENKQERLTFNQKQYEFVDYAQAKCLATNIYFEARGESKLGQKAVAWVTLNRVEDPNYPDTICDVVWDNKQFSWTHDGKSDVPKDRDAWLEAQLMAFQVLVDYQLNNEDPTEGSIMFHEATIKPEWRKEYEVTSRIDNHIFYKDESS